MSQNAWLSMFLQLAVALTHPSASDTVPTLCQLLEGTRLQTCFDPETLPVPSTVKFANVLV